MALGCYLVMEEIRVSQTMNLPDPDSEVPSVVYFFFFSSWLASFCLLITQRLRASMRVSHVGCGLTCFRHIFSISRRHSTGLSLLIMSNSPTSMQSFTPRSCHLLDMYQSSFCRSPRSAVTSLLSISVHAHQITHSKTVFTLSSVQARLLTLDS